MAKQKVSYTPVVVKNKEVKTILEELGAVLMEDSATHQCRIEIRSASSNRAYVVSRRKGGGWECSCPGWIFKHKDCKHITAMKPSLEKIILLLEDKKKK